MDHLDAAQNKAVERYMLGDLSASEVEEFERHFFDCPQCSEELRALTIFRENARAVFLDPDPVLVPIRTTVPKSTASWWSRISPLSFSMGAAMAVALIGIFAALTAFRVSQFSEYAIKSEVRSVGGEETVVSPRSRWEPYAVYFDKTWPEQDTHLRASVRDLSGNEKFSKELTLDPGAEAGSIHVLIPPFRLSDGKYVVVLLRGGAGSETEVARLSFTLRVQ